jgi:ribosome-binding protein aMBF1 (putative translation factor)
MTRVTINELTVDRLAVASPFEQAAFIRSYESTRLALAIGDKLRDAREAARLSQHDLAARAGISHAALARVEVGHVGTTHPTLHKIATELGLRVTVTFSEARSAT